MNQAQYAKEMQERYLRFVQKEDQNELRLFQKLKKENDRREDVQKKKIRKATGPQEPAEQTILGMDRYVAPRYRVYNIIVDSQHRDVATFPNTNEFVVRLQDTIKNVAAVRMLRSEFYSPANRMGYFVLNDARIPLQLYNVEHAYLYLNGYQTAMIANDGNLALFGRIGPGTEIYPGMSGDPLQDPFIHVLRPTEPKLRKFHVRLVTADGELYPLTDARIVLTLAIYCLV